MAPLVLLEAALLVKVLLTSPGAKSMTVHWGRTLEPPAIGSIYVRGIVLT